MSGNLSMHCHSWLRPTEVLTSEVEMLPPDRVLYFNQRKKYTGMCEYCTLIQNSSCLAGQVNNNNNAVSNEPERERKEQGISRDNIDSRIELWSAPYVSSGCAYGVLHMLPLEGPMECSICYL